MRCVDEKSRDWPEEEGWCSGQGKLEQGNSSLLLEASWAGEKGLHASLMYKQHCIKTFAWLSLDFSS